MTSAQELEQIAAFLQVYQERRYFLLPSRSKAAKSGWTDLSELQATELTDLYTKSQSLLLRQKTLQESSSQADRLRSDSAMAQAAARQAFDVKLRELAAQRPPAFPMNQGSIPGSFPPPVFHQAP